MASKRALSGIKPSGTPHLGNLLGMLQPAIGLQETHDCYYFIADYHALTTMRDATKMKRHSMEVAATYLALGLDPERAVFFRQSDIPEVCELTWFLSCMTGMGLLERAHAFKDARAKGKEVNHGLFAYPVLMAADILLYNSNVVPVGKDQKQHVEMTRDIAQRFNTSFGEVLTLPEPLIREEVMTIPGLDGRKMSKSYGNVIELFASPKQLRKQVMRIVTDSKTMEEPKDPDTCNVFALYQLLADPKDIEGLAEKYRAGNFGYGHAKQAVYELLMDRLGPARERYVELLASPETIERILATGAARARKTACKVMLEVREATGIGPAI